MTVLVGRRESFNAAHQLYDPDLSEAENRLDLKLLSDVITKQIIRDVDHRNLNTDVSWLSGCLPTAENLAQAFWERLEPELPDGLLRSVRVWETDKNWAEVGDRA